MILEGLDNVGDSGSLLADGDVDTEELLLGVTSPEVGFLVDDGIDSDGSLASLTVTNDELSLSSTNGHQTVHSLQSALHRLVHRFSRDDTGSLDLDSFSLVGLDGALAVDGISQGIEDSTQHFLADGDVDDGSSPSDSVSFLDLSIVSEDDDTDVVSLEVEGHASDT